MDTNRISIFTTLKENDAGRARTKTRKNYLVLYL